MKSDKVAIALSHFSIKPVEAVRSVEQQELLSYFQKPSGFWVSVDGEDDWATWCASSMPQWLEGVIRHEVILADEANVLKIPAEMPLPVFEEKYGRDVHLGAGLLSEKGIDWQAVAKDYDGIIIAPYCWSYRMDRMWYYTWDCASGCIWNANAIASIKEIS